MAKKVNGFNMVKSVDHIAFIMDGNGRWAKARKRPRTYGHKVAIDNLIKLIKECNALGIKAVSLFAFSTENWKRDPKEIKCLFSYLETFLDKYLKDFKKNDIKLLVSGEYAKLPKTCVTKINNAIKETKSNKGLKVNICLNYGGTQEIIRAVNNIIKDKLNKVDIDTFNKYLYHYDEIGPIDLMIRTSGEERISNFMLSYLAYSELIFTKTYFPDFKEKDLHECLLEYFKRDRRFGGAK